MNQPKIPSYGCWNPHAITFENSSTVGLSRYNTVFVDRNNTVYATNEYQEQVYVWYEDDSSGSKTSFDTLLRPTSLFVTIDGNIFVGDRDGSVEKLTPNAAKGVLVKKFDGGCDGLFVDVENNLYCSSRYTHRVMKQSLLTDANTSDVVAGTGTSGSTAKELNYPRGIFVDINLDLYVADCGNNRVQLFEVGEINGTTVAGNTGAFGISLSCPTAVYFDADKYLFIVDQNNNRIIRSTFNGFECVAGCSGVYGVASNQLSYPSVAAFDQYGNIFVADSLNYRIQKFIFMLNASGK